MLNILFPLQTDTIIDSRKSMLGIYALRVTTTVFFFKLNWNNILDPHLCSFLYDYEPSLLQDINKSAQKILTYTFLVGCVGYTRMGGNNDSKNFNNLYSQTWDCLNHRTHFFSLFQKMKSYRLVNWKRLRVINSSNGLNVIRQILCLVDRIRKTFMNYPHSKWLSKNWM